MSTSSIDDGQAIAGGRDEVPEEELLARYLAQDWPFQSLGESIVSVRHDNLNVYSDELGEYYLEQVYRSPSGEPLRPHPYQLATMAYLHLRRLGEDQSILLDGIRGSGKTEMYWEMFHQISRAAGASHEPIAQHLQRVLNSFGTGMRGESKHGIYQELQFSTRGKLQGVKTLSFYLDLHSGPSTFQVMRQFEEGVTEDERHRYQLEVGSVSNEFSELMESLKQLGVKAKSRTKMRQVMGSMLLLQRARFEADSEGAACHDLDEPAIYLGLTPATLLSHLNERTITVGREKCSQLLTVEQAQNQLNEFLGFVYNLLYQHVLEKINLKLCSDDDPSFIAMLDFPGLDPLAASGGLGTFVRNYTAEMVHGHIMAHLTDADHVLAEMDQDGLEGGYVPQVPTLLPVLRGDVTSLLTTLDVENGDRLGPSLGKNLSSQPGFRMDPTDGGNRFILTHYAGEVTYNLNGFQDTNRNAMAGSWAQLLATSHEMFVNDLVHALVTPSSDSKVDVRKSVLIRHPSTKHRESLPKQIAQPTILNQLDGLLEEILSTLSQTRQWVALCLNPNADHTVQMGGLHLSELESRVGTSFTQSQNRHDFLVRYQSAIPPDGHLETCLEHLGLENGKEFVLGNTRIYLTPRGFMLLEGMRRNPDRGVPSGFSEASPPTDDDEGGFEKEKKEMPNKVVESASRVTKARQAWVRLTWMMTWWIPDWCIIRCGRMTRPDVQMAWREKVTICLLIFWSWFIILFVNIGLGLILCPANKVWKPSEITTLQGPTDLGVYMYGNVYDITQFAQHRHGKSINPAGVDPETMLQFGGLDVTSTFPVPLTASCPGLVTDPNFKLWVNISDDTLSSNLFIHDSGPLTQYPATSLKDPNWFFTNALPQLKSMKKGEVVYDFSDLTAYRKAGYKQWGAINNRVYDLTAYVQTLQQPQFQVNVPGVANPAFLPNTVLQMFSSNSPAPDADLTSLWNKRSGLSPSERASVLRCLDRTFFVGTVDLRKTMRCQVTNVMLLVSSGMILLVTLVKFLAALQLTSRRSPTDYDKFVICQVPCYTEGEESIRRTLESLALLNYDDKHKLIFVIADGMIIGSGNDRPTPASSWMCWGSTQRWTQNRLPSAASARATSSSTMARYTQAYLELMGAQCHTLWR
ncbi:hypothetical protein DSO57_1023843 [Entomophthora muscae]|uniref:Uncharacterized protein n=1 Tax=Entomophthora muscae TaxID=34485 RepID=A0ACC2RHG2_9FUNG|nr:hypothetical protein DSO57_1023843 [Entomophthora muscae]